MGLRTRLVLIVVLGSGLSLLASLLVLMRLEQRAEARSAAERAGALLHTVSVPVALLLTQGRVPDLDNLMSELDDRKDALDLSVLILVDHEGVVLAHTDSSLYGLPLQADPFIEDAIRSPRPVVDRSDGQPVRVAVPVQTGIRWGTLIGTLSTEALAARVSARRERLIVTAFVVSAIGLITLLFILSTWVVAPIRAASRAAERFAEGDLTARAPARGGDEIALLSHALNTAAERLGSYTTELESEVKKRTEALEKANDELQQANERLELLAVTDGLTGLYNHRHFHEALEREVERQQRGLQPFTVLMMDVDHFKHYNDAHGHPAGDKVLVQIAELLRENTRGTDVVARYGGEEFIVLLLEASHPWGVARAQRLRELIEKHPFPHREEQPLGAVTISLGVATWPDDALTARGLVRVADRALYASKRRGRNRVTDARAIGAYDDGSEDAPDESGEEDA